MKAQNKYWLPVNKEDLVKLDRTSSPAHKGKLKHSVDFLFTHSLNDFSIEGRPILAAADGEVIYVKQDSTSGGPDKKYWNAGNALMIKHANGEFSYYEHLKYNGAVVKVGDFVNRGDLIGYSGNTGYTFLSHLHFQVHRFTGPGREDYETLEIKFEDYKENG